MTGDRFHRCIRFYVLFFFVIASIAQAQTRDTIRVCTWNVLNYGQVDDANRNAAFRTVLSQIHPDILVTQEIREELGMQWFYGTNVLPLGPYGYAPFTDGYDTDNAMYYDTTSIELITALTLVTDLREIDGWRVRSRVTGQECYVFSLHLKADQGEANEQARLSEAKILRNYLDALDPQTKVIVAGDWNVYSSDEPVYTLMAYTLTGGQLTAGKLYDPINKNGNWHDDERFAQWHTQSPRQRQFGGGATGGMDDRFDQILISSSLRNLYRQGSYTTFGNDGQHFNDSITAMPNTAVDQVTAQALHDASDHLPVYLDLVFTASPAGVEDDTIWLKEMNLSEKK